MSPLMEISRGRDERRHSVVLGGARACVSEDVRRGGGCRAGRGAVVGGRSGAAVEAAAETETRRGDSGNRERRLKRQGRGCRRVDSKEGRVDEEGSEETQKRTRGPRGRGCRRGLNRRHPRRDGGPGWGASEQAGTVRFAPVYKITFSAWTERPTPLQRIQLMENN